MHILAWVIGIPVVFLLAIYVKLLFGPIPLPFFRAQVHTAAVEALPDSFSIEIGEISLALERALWPVIQLSPVNLSDNDTGADIKMDALAVGFSPLQAIIGQPGLSITLVRPQIQIVQDLFGPRIAGFELVDDKDGNDATIWVLEGDSSLPSVKISSEGLDIRGAIPKGSELDFRSDNDWLIYNMKASEESLAAFESQTKSGRFSRLRVKDGALDMHDSVYGLFRQFTGIEFDIASNSKGDVIKGHFAAVLAGRSIEGTVTRALEDTGDTSLRMDVENLDFASLLPFIDDPDGLMAVKGGGDLHTDVRFDSETGQVLGGVFNVDMSGTSLRVRDDLFPIKTDNVSIVWAPALSQFSIEHAKLRVGDSSGELSGVFVMGLDESFGPTLSASILGENVLVHPNDLDAPDNAFTQMAFSGWSAPLYGAIGVDQMIIQREDMLLRMKGRIDMLRSGIGLDVEIGGQGATADDLKRLWPYILSTEARNWFVDNVKDGVVESSAMRFKFPVGSITIGEEEKAIPKGALSIDMTGSNVRFTASDTMSPIAINGLTKVKVRDSTTTVGMDGASISTNEGPVSLSNVAFIIDTDLVEPGVFEISGDVSGSMQSLLDLAEDQSPGALDNIDIPIDPKQFAGDLNGSLVATIVIDHDDEVLSIDYAANGVIADFASGEPVSGYTIDNGQFGFSVSQDGYNLRGPAQISGLGANISLSGKIDGDPEVLVSAGLNVEQIKELGFDTSEFLDGEVQFVAKPIADGEMQIAADITNASINIADLGIRKAKGVEGQLSASVLQKGEKFDISDVSLTFDDVNIKGSLIVDSADGLESGEFTTFALSPGDDATVAIASTDNGISLKMRGDRLDLKPMLKRAFALDQSSAGGPQSTQLDQTLLLDIELKQAVGFYRTIAYNFDLDMDLRGDDLRRVSLQAQFAEGSGVSITTNPVQGGRTMSVAFNDAGTLLRFLNVYPRLLGGQGNLTMTTDAASKVDTGVLNLREFSLVDEAKVAEILGNHRDSQSLISRENRIKFNSGEMRFIRRSDRIEVSDAILNGDTIGGTLRGFIYTKKREYDLVGTYVPLFGLNSIFQKLPLFGPILGGREGEGLVGVTFAIRGDLDGPKFLINPASILLPGAFRSLFEFRAREAPREQ